jgi:hypothetical protein
MDLTTVVCAFGGVNAVFLFTLGIWRCVVMVSEVLSFSVRQNVSVAIQQI